MSSQIKATGSLKIAEKIERWLKISFWKGCEPG
jgi:hypothetical protein